MPPPRTPAHHAPALEGFHILPISMSSVSTKARQLWPKFSNSLCRFCRFRKNDPEGLRPTARPSVQATDVVQQGGCTVSRDELAVMVRERNRRSLRGYGGINGLAHHLNTSLNSGVQDASSQIESRRNEFGANSHPRYPQKSFFSCFLDACKDPALFTFIVLALHSFASGIESHGQGEGWYEGVAITIAVVLTILVTSFTNYNQGLQFLKLKKNKETQKILVDVRRGGKKMKVPIFDLVVGDIAFLETGDQVPADGLFVDGCSLHVDESTMTGEVDPVCVNRRMPFLLAGCMVTEGSGKMMVTGVGIKTEWGRLLAESKDNVREATPLQICLDGISSFLHHIGWAVTLLGSFILLTSDFFVHKGDSNDSGMFEAGHRTVLNTIVVLVLPKGLPFAMTVSLAHGMKRMMDDRALVRRLSACETMGSVTTICADKTGTLTMNQMTVKKTWVVGEYRDAEGVDLSPGVRSVILEGIAQNRTPNDIPEEGEELEVMGSPIEKALLAWGLKLGMNFSSVKALSKVLRVEPFDSIERCAGVAVRVGASGNVHAHWKGAAETILERCDGVLGNDNCKVMLTDSKKQELLDVIHGMSADGLHCVAFGYRKLEEVKVPRDEEQLEAWKIPQGPLTLTAIVGMKDPCRPGVADAVVKCQAAGVKVRMITGDSLATAKAVAAECHILQSGIAIEGSTFRGYSAEKKREEAPKIGVLACASPSDKLSMVRTLREVGEVVAVMGDGFNDVSALNEADVGLSMGMGGTEAAKESSDIIILDNKVESVVNMLCWGRLIYLNIQKFIQFQTTVNVVAFCVNFVAAVYVGDGPLAAVQLLWVNIIVSTLGALALAMVPPTGKELQGPPVQCAEPLISNVMIRNVLVQALYQVVVLIVLVFWGRGILRLEGPDAGNINATVIFNAFFLCQLFNLANARELEEWNILKGLLNNRCFVGILCIALTLQIIAVEFLSKFASTTKLSLQLWLICIVIGFFTWPAALLGKFLPVPKKSLCNVQLQASCSANRQPNEPRRGVGTMTTAVMSGNREFIVTIS